MRAYYRMASSLRAWPEMKGIVAYGWFHDPAAFQENPHLEFMNRPYLEGGGALFRLEEATLESGFAENNPERVRRYQSGELRYHMHAAVWPREAALAGAGWSSIEQLQSDRKQFETWSQFVLDELTNRR